MATVCEDGIKDGTESDLDCGGAACPKCNGGKVCGLDSDCISRVCNMSNKTCVASLCDNGALDSGETDVDCGGPTCSKCGLTKACLAGADCLSSFCHTTNKNCVASQCLDGTTNGAETDLDCGGTVCTKCTVGKSCAANSDCASANCNLTTHKCVSTQCQNGVKDAPETDVDCGGGTCAACVPPQGCLADRDCNPMFCNETTARCVASQCVDGSTNGSETDVDCGGPTCSLRCALGFSCLAAGDCASNACHATTKKCVATRCLDAVKNDNETDADCGGNSCPRCANGGSCLLPADCTSGFCHPSTKLCVAAFAESNCLDGVDNNGDGLIDCADPSCTSVQCVPSAAAGNEIGTLQAGACPAGFGPAQTFNKDLSIPACSGCGCGGDPGCAVDIWVDTTTTSCAALTPLGTFMHFNADPVCRNISSIAGIKSFSPANVRPINCTPNGAANRGTPAWQTVNTFCAATATSPSCPAGSVCVGKPAAAPVCIRVPSPAAGCPAGYTTGAAATYYTGFTDGRSCGACQCSVSANCGTETYLVTDDVSCPFSSGAKASIAATGTCANTGAWGGAPFASITNSMSARLFGFAQNASCSASSQTSGGVTPTGGSTICCR